MELNTQILFLGLQIFILIILIKINVTSKNYATIIEAIFNYNITQADEDLNKYYKNKISYEDLRCFPYAVFDLIDWGYKNLLSKENYDKVKEFIK